MIMSDKFDVQEIKARASMTEVLDQYGVRMKLADAWDDEVEVWCPFCADEYSDKPAGRANDMKGVYFCFACGFGGDVITVVRQMRGCGFDEALDKLNAWFPAEQENPWTS